MSDKFYITTSIPYVNDVPHIGHAMEFIQADVLARYHREHGVETVFATGTDEHGGKVMEKAESLGITPQRYADQISLAFKDLMTVLNVEYDRFTRTSDKTHETAAQAIWKDLEKYIYKGKYVGMYDQKEETFLTEEEAREIKEHDPERHAKLHKLEEENYFFKLSEFTKQIREAVDSEEFRVVPQTRRNEIMQLLKDGLEDISISRPVAKIPWGIQVPGDKEQTMYVWFEALMNYITVLGYPKGDMEKFWPADVQVVGKDITRFHAAIWPGMLLGLGLELPKNLYVHGFITMNGKKMSKSVGNVIAPLEIISGYGADAMRYFFLSHIPSYGDGDFSWEKFESAYNGELGNELGNLVQRTSSMINRYQDGVIGTMPASEHDEGPYHEAMRNYRFDKALEYTWGLIRGLNQYIEQEKPWQIEKDRDQEHLREVLAYTASSIVQIAGLLGPFLPKTADAIKSIFSEGVVKNYDGCAIPTDSQLYRSLAKDLKYIIFLPPLIIDCKPQFIDTIDIRL